jgi:antitoxin component YwqK of YwqJK toxin-antitoxin module
LAIGGLLAFAVAGCASRRGINMHFGFAKSHPDSYREPKARVSRSHLTGYTVILLNYTFIYPKVKTTVYTVLCLIASHAVCGQGVTRKTFHDAAGKNLKESYQVKDTVSNILHGRYISYYLNGNVESRGQFTDNETTGIWEFFYETGKIKMRGILKQNANYGLWEYFYESGQMSMQGNVNGKHREGEWTAYYENGQVREVGVYVKNKRHGLWKTYFEDGVLKGEIDYIHDTGRYTEYYHSGKVSGEGPKKGNLNIGHWRYFGDTGTIESEGKFENGRKHGEWIYYHPDGKISGRGSYVHAGEYREYYPSGKLKTKGTVIDDKREGKWEFFYEDGRREGECVYKNNTGVYFGYFLNGSLQTKGAMTGDLKTGTWEIYQEDGVLSGYYRPFYENKKLSEEIVSLADKSVTPPKKVVRRGTGLRHFDPRVNEFRGLIVGGNPLMVFAGKLPLGVEFYLQERLGHEFEFIGIRDPFFKADLNIPTGDKFERGYSICIKQKLYNPLHTGMWYFGHEIRFTNFGHFINQPISTTSSELFTFSSVEQRIEWGLLLGYRICKSNVRQGFTIDAFVSGDVGYRGFDVDPKYASYFDDINQSRVSTSFHFGVNFGNVFSFR